MTPERWQEVSRIFKSAIELEGDAREAYLARACGHDKSVREEVSRLISSHNKASAENFIDTPPFPGSGRSDSEVRRLVDGQQVGPYRILKHLGTGGMGEVYLSSDTRLDRLVALKILSGELASDNRRMQRFQQEARMVSSLNQPNILTVFEFVEIESLHCLASEYVDGETLREYLKRNRLKLSEVLDITLQICAALDAAHESNIVHRDIKPENVMIRRRDHIVKVLDFGLAKGTEPPSVTHATDSEIATQFKTAAGTIVGTVNYMSPEQAQGLRVDRRTDLWSTGVVLYEMVTGQLPFKGRTSSHTIVQILETEPAPLKQVGGVAVPDELQRIVGKAITKNPEERYQTAKDLLIDLRSLRKQLDIETELKHSTGSGSGEQSNKTTSVADVGPTTESPAPRSEGNARKIIMVFGIVALLIVGLWAFNQTRLRQQPSNTVTPAPAVERVLTYSVTVQKYRDNKPFEAPFQLAKEMVFERDYQIRLNISSQQSGFLYILNEGPHEQGQPADFVVLFPSTTSNAGSALVSEGQRIQIPEQSWITFDKEKGTERVWLVFAAKAIQELEPIRSYASQKTQGLITDAGVRDTLQNFLRNGSAPKTSVEQNAERKETRVSSRGDVLIHAIDLEHQ